MKLNKSLSTVKIEGINTHRHFFTQLISKLFHQKFQEWETFLYITLLFTSKWSRIYFFLVLLILIFFIALFYWSIGFSIMCVYVLVEKYLSLFSVKCEFCKYMTYSEIWMKYVIYSTMIATQLKSFVHYYATFQRPKTLCETRLKRDEWHLNFFISWVKTNITWTLWVLPGEVPTILIPTVDNGYTPDAFNNIYHARGVFKGNFSTKLQDIILRMPPKLPKKFHYSRGSRK